jgi:hypothetical protein
MNLGKATGRGIVLAGLAAGLVAGLAGCTSEAAQERQQQAEARRQVADEGQDVRGQDVQAQESSGEADRALMLREQDQLDATEQKRTNNVYAHSCRKVTLASYALKASNVDTAQCTPERLKLEQDAERQQNTMEQRKKP